MGLSDVLPDAPLYSGKNEETQDQNFWVVITSNFREIDQGSGLNDNQSEGSIFELCQRHNVGVIGIRSHAAGAIVNMLDRIVNKEDSLYKMHQNASELDGIRKNMVSVFAEMALIFFIKNSNITTTVPGIKNRQELNQSINCANTSVEDELVIEIAKWYKKKLKQD